MAETLLAERKKNDVDVVLFFVNATYKWCVIGDG